MTKESSPKSDYLKSIMEKSIGENPASNRIIPIEKKIVEDKNRENKASARETALECWANPSDLKSPKQAEPTGEQLEAFREGWGDILGMVGGGGLEVCERPFMLISLNRFLYYIFYIIETRVLHSIKRHS